MLKNLRSIFRQGRGYKANIWFSAVCQKCLLNLATTNLMHHATGGCKTVQVNNARKRFTGMGKEAIGAFNMVVYKRIASGPTKLLNTLILL
ncbi:hypothetical protein CMV_015240 [Castanea mollissima]|uniref:Uncharacterized protein n=1 Tax=Castanea mollissima TaxID=60419 RepID=A0A8J4VK99_9ROSI|nr:hypothetical protein CMV_015240 [Castanea mollissima]